MMLLFATHSISAEKFSAPISGLRSLLVVPDADDAAGTRGGCVVTRAAVDAHACGHRDDVVKARRDDDDDRTNLGHRGEDGETAKEEEEEEKNEEDDNMEVKEREEEDELDGFWVSYGRRRPRRRLPPPIPSLVARGALRRTRTDDGRLVIRIVPVVRPECIRARRRRDRLVEHEDDSPVTPLPPLCEPMTAASEDGIRIDVAHQAEDDDAAAPPAREGVCEVEDAVAAPAETLPAAVPPRRVPSVGCFEEVFKLGSIGSSSLHQMPSLRMVH